MHFVERHKGIIILNFSAILLFAILAFFQTIPKDLNFSFLVSGATDRFMHFMIGVSSALHPGALVLVSIIFSIFLIWHRKITWALFFLMSLFLTIVSALVIKDFLAIARPVNQVVFENGWSFPSVHVASVSVFFFASLYAIEEKIHDSAIVALWALVAFFLVASVGMSRVYLGVHWVSDVFAGFALGVFWVTLGILVLEKVKEHAEIRNQTSRR